MTDEGASNASIQIGRQGISLVTPGMVSMIASSSQVLTQVLGGSGVAARDGGALGVVGGEDAMVFGAVSWNVDESVTMGCCGMI